MTFDAVVVGAGPAGVSCAIWLKQMGFSVVVVDRNAQCGGLQLANPYTNTWIATSADAWGRDVAKAMHDNMLRHRVDMRLGRSAVLAGASGSIVEVALDDGEAFSGRNLVLAGGVSPKSGGFVSRLGLIVGPGPSVANTRFEGEDVAILGGGDSAFENYLFAKERGARSVTIFARNLRARSEMLAKVPVGDVVLGPCEVDADGRSVNGMAFGQILVLYGYEANAKSLLGMQLAMRPDGFVATNEDCETSLPNVFAIGEIARRAHPCCVTAMADGVVAAKAIQRRLEQSASARFVGAAKRAFSLGLRVAA